MMRTFFMISLGLLVSFAGAGCKNAEGRFRPPDPIGYAIFELLDRGPRSNTGPAAWDADTQYVGGDDYIGAPPPRPSPDSVWVDGTWGTSNGRRVWIPAHWQ